MIAVSFTGWRDGEQCTGYPFFMTEDGKKRSACLADLWLKSVNSPPEKTKIAAGWLALPQGGTEIRVFRNIPIASISFGRLTKS